MKSFIPLFSGFVAACAIFPAIAHDPAESTARDKDVPTKVEYYYRIKWGSLRDFIALYEKNHQPLLDDMKSSGFVLETKTEYPFTHLAGGPRWDMRVSITYKDAAAAVNDPAWEAAWLEAKKRRYKDIKKFDGEEAKRFSAVEEHWDVIVSDFPG